MVQDDPEWDPKLMIAINLDQICDFDQDPDHNMRSNLVLGISNERSRLPLTATTYTATFRHTFISIFFKIVFQN